MLVSFSISSHLSERRPPKTDNPQRIDSQRHKDDSHELFFTEWRDYNDWIDYNCPVWGRAAQSDTGSHVQNAMTQSNNKICDVDQNNNDYGVVFLARCGSLLTVDGKVTVLQVQGLKWRRIASDRHDYHHQLSYHDRHVQLSHFNHQVQHSLIIIFNFASLRPQMALTSV